MDGRRPELSFMHCRPGGSNGVCYQLYYSAICSPKGHGSSGVAAEEVPVLLLQPFPFPVPDRNICDSRAPDLLSPKGYGVCETE